MAAPHLAQAIEAEVAEWIQERQHLQDEQGRRQVVRNGRLPHLRELALADNRLSDLPDAIFELPRLRRLLLAGNSFSDLAASRIQGWFKPGVVAVYSNKATS